MANENNPRNKRTDVHRPSVINPEDYDYVCFRYHGPDIGMIMAAKGQMEIFNAHMARTGGRFSAHEHGGSCHVCGASANYLVTWYHPASNRYIQTGADCAAKMDMLDAVAFRSWKKKLAAGAKVYAGKAKAEATLKDAGLEAAWDLTQNNDARATDAWAWDTLTDMVDKLVRYGSWSEKQFGFAGKLVARLTAPPPVVENHNPGEFVGTVGERIEFEARLKYKAGFDTVYGWMNVLVFEAADGNALVWKTSSEPVALEALHNMGRDEKKAAMDVMRFKVRGRIKKHEAYENKRRGTTTNQTILTRCSVEILVDEKGEPWVEPEARRTAADVVNELKAGASVADVNKRPAEEFAF